MSSSEHGDITLRHPEEDHPKHEQHTSIQLPLQEDENEQELDSAGKARKNSKPGILRRKRSKSADGRPRDSKGWDGKLRINKVSDAHSADGADAEEQHNEDEDTGEDERKIRVETEDGPEPDLIEADEDLCADLEDEVEDIDLVHCRITSLPALKLDRFKKVERLCLRQNRIQYIKIPDNLKPTLKELDLYDNNIKRVDGGLEGFEKLKSLDLSFNNIRHIEGVRHLTTLTDIYFVHNKIKEIQGLEGLSSLRNLELGGNRISHVTGLETLTALEQLWLGKNHITELQGLNSSTSLKILSIQANRLRNISGLSALTQLEELHISHNAISSLQGLEANTNLRVIDISSNPISKLEGLEKLDRLEELWASNCKLDSFEEVEQQLKDKKELNTVYFEGNPLQLRQPVLYRNKVRLALPQIKQIDASRTRPPEHC